VPHFLHTFAFVALAYEQDVHRIRGI
jgi:hypothetical protein